MMNLVARSPLPYIRFLSRVIIHQSYSSFSPMKSPVVLQFSREARGVRCFLGHLAGGVSTPAELGFDASELFAPSGRAVDP